jgi:hypothetical protein
MKRFLVAALFAACTITAFALPSVDAVKAEVAKGHDVQAEQMIREVLAARPDSARARYVHAELLAHQGRFAQAADEAAQARRLDPSLSFTQPDTFRSFEAMLAREQSAAAGRHGTAAALQPPAVVASGGVPGWVWGGGLALVALLLLSRFAFAGRQASGSTTATLVPAAAGTGGFGAAPAPYGTGAAPVPYGMAPAAPAGGVGSGLLGTGMAVAGGVAAGMLAERLLEGHREPAATTLWPSAPASAVAPAMPDFEDTQIDVATARELEERPIDMGTGDGWGGDVGDIAPSDNNDGW